MSKTKQPLTAQELEELGKALALLETIKPRLIAAEAEAKLAFVDADTKPKRITQASALRREAARIEAAEATHRADKVSDARNALRSLLNSCQQ